MTELKKRRVSHRGCKEKGSNYEREIAEYLSKATGLVVRRALLSGGGRHEGAADLEGLVGISAELKRTEKLNVYDAMAQSISTSGRTKEVPVVITRRNGVLTQDSLVIMRLSDWTRIYQEAKLPRSGH